MKMKDIHPRFEHFVRLRLILAGLICLCNLAALCLAFWAGHEYARRKAGLKQKKAPCGHGNTQGAAGDGSAGENMWQQAEAEWDKDSGAG